MKRALMAAAAIVYWIVPVASAQTMMARVATRKTIIQLEERWLANENSAAVLDEILANDFVHVLPEGMISKKGHIDFVREHPFGPFAVHKFEQLDVRVYGNVAVATGIVLAIPATKTMPQRTLFTDVFVFRKGRWQAVNAQETPAAGNVK